MVRLQYKSSSTSAASGHTVICFVSTVFRDSVVATLEKDLQFVNGQKARSKGSLPVSTNQILARSLCGRNNGKELVRINHSRGGRYVRPVSRWARGPPAHGRRKKPRSFRGFDVIYLKPGRMTVVPGAGEPFDDPSGRVMVAGMRLKMQDTTNCEVWLR